MLGDLFNVLKTQEVLVSTKKMGAPISLSLNLFKPKDSETTFDFSTATMLSVGQANGLTGCVIGQADLASVVMTPEYGTDGKSTGFGLIEFQFSKEVQGLTVDSSKGKLPVFINLVVDIKTKIDNFVSVTQADDVLKLGLQITHSNMASLNYSLKSLSYDEFKVKFANSNLLKDESSKMWHGRALTLALMVFKTLFNLRDGGLVDLNASMLKDQFELDTMRALLKKHQDSGFIGQDFLEYIESNTSEDEAKQRKQLEQHGFIAMQIGRMIRDLEKYMLFSPIGIKAETYGLIELEHESFHKPLQIIACEVDQLSMENIEFIQGILLDTRFQADLRRAMALAWRPLCF